MKKIITSILLIFIFLFSIILFVQDKKEFSDNENRYLQTEAQFTMDRLLSGNFISDFENLLVDQFPLRDYFMNLKFLVDKILLKDNINNIYLGKDNYLLQKYEKPKNTDEIINAINNLDLDINLSLMLVPTSITINKDKLPKNAVTYDELQTINYIYNSVHIDTINVYDNLKNSKNQVFYYLDHHWTTYGAYEAYKAFKPDYKTYKFNKVSDNFKGTLYSASNDFLKKPDEIYSIDTNKVKVEYVFSKKIKSSLYEESYLDKKDKYSYFLDNNHPLIIIENLETTNTDELVIIKDSYANSFIPFLVSHYKKIHVIDPRFYKLSISDYVKENSINEGLILYNINTLDSDLGIRQVH